MGIMSGGMWPWTCWTDREKRSEREAWAQTWFTETHGPPRREGVRSQLFLTCVDRGLCSIHCPCALTKYLPKLYGSQSKSQFYIILSKATCSQFEILCASVSNNRKEIQVNICIVVILIWSVSIVGVKRNLHWPLFYFTAQTVDQPCRPANVWRP